MGIKFKLELNLQQMSSIQVAANIWLSHPMIAEICDFFSKNNIDYKSPGDDKFKIEMRKWLIGIFEQFNSMRFPYAIRNNFSHIIKPVGENLLDYLGRISARWNSVFGKQSFPGLDVHCKYIEFDCIGRVDEVKTFLNIYNACQNVSLLFLFFEACTYCLEDVIHSIWNKCSDQIKLKVEQTISASLGFKGNNIYKIQQYWMQFVDKKQLKLPNRIIEKNALEYCAQEENSVGINYFMNKLSQDEKNRILVSLAKDVFEDLDSRDNWVYIKPSEIPKQDTYNLFSLMAQMTEDGKNKFYSCNRKKIILRLVYEWPWKYLLLDFNYSNKNLYCWSIEQIVKKIIDDYNFYKKIVYTDLWMIPEIWKKCPDNLEKSIVEICWSIEKSIMFKLQAAILVTSVIDDTDGVDKLRPEICKSFKIYCKKFIDRQKYEVVDLYMKNILQNDEERETYEELLQSRNVN